MKIGITGATGKLGGLVVEELKKRVPAENLVALVRNPQKATGLGIEARAFDYNKPEQLSQALAGINSMLLISGNEIGQRARQHTNVINAAKAAGVKQIVYTSLLHADKSGLNLAAEHLATENALKAAGIAYTILRNGWYTENYTASIAGAIAAGAFTGCAGNGKISSAIRADYAEAAAVVLNSKGHEGKVYELSGDESYTLSDLATEISRQTGKSIPYTNMTETEYADILKKAGFPDGLAAAFASWDTGVLNGDLYDDGHVLSTLLGHPTTPLAKAVAAAIKG